MPESLTDCNTLLFSLIEGSRLSSPLTGRVEILNLQREKGLSLAWIDPLKHEDILKIVNLKVTQQIPTH